MEWKVICDIRDGDPEGYDHIVIRSFDFKESEKGKMIASLKLIQHPWSGDLCKHLRKMNDSMKSCYHKMVRAPSIFLCFKHHHNTMSTLLKYLYYTQERVHSTRLGSIKDTLKQHLNMVTTHEFLKVSCSILKYVFIFVQIFLT